MLVKEVMSRDVLAVRADTPLSEALDILAQQDGGVLAVYDASRLIGTLNEHDIATWQTRNPQDPSVIQVQDVMRAQGPFTLEDQDAREVARAMKQQHVSGMVVLRDGQPVGTVSLADLAAGEHDGGAPSAQRNGFLIVPQRTEEQVAAPEARVFLQPIAAPSILGLFGFSAATFMVGAHIAGWYGGAASPYYLAPFAALFGGLAQFIAGMWAYKARDGVATAIHGMWGAFWMAFGLLYLLVGAKVLPAGPVNLNFGWWFIPIAAITFFGAIAAIADNLGMSLVLWLLTIASILAAIFLLVGSSLGYIIAGYFFMASAVVAWYTAGGMVLEGAFRRVILPLGKIGGPNKPGSRSSYRPVEYKYGQPGVRVGQ
jgi:succinate-acetate transporter protein/CBS domain-containing protein